VRLSPNTDAQLGATVLAALQIRDAMRRDGATVAEADAALERTLRVAWPHAREWKHLCVACRDYGLVLAECPGDTTCGRPNPHERHSYGTACHCDKGRPFRAKAAPTDDDAVAVAAKSPNRRMARWGR
jgi:hypothetical protein